ncbi:MAG: LysR family transcriptional regulator [Akkermansiaceae bacterium]
MNLTIKQLQYFHQFSKTGNVSVSASNLGVSQPALTAALQKIEKDLDTELFNRSKGYIELNKNGSLLAPQVARLLDGYNHISDVADNIAVSLESDHAHICIPHTPWTSSLRAALISDPRFIVRTPERIRAFNRLYDATVVFHFCSNFAKPGFKVTEIMKIQGMCSAKTPNCQLFEAKNSHCELLVPTESLLVGIRQMLISQSADEAGLSTKIIHELNRYDQIIVSTMCPKVMAVLPGPASKWAEQYNNIVEFTDIENFANFNLIVSLVTPLKSKPELISEITETVKSHMLGNAPHTN